MRNGGTGPHMWRITRAEADLSSPKDNPRTSAVVHSLTCFTKPCLFSYLPIKQAIFFSPQEMNFLEPMFLITVLRWEWEFSVTSQETTGVFVYVETAQNQDSRFPLRQLEPGQPQGLYSWFLLRHCALQAPERWQRSELWSTYLELMRSPGL